MSLALKNPHKRDENITHVSFPARKYIIKTDPNSFYMSVTTWCGNLFPKFNADLIIENMMKGKQWTPENKYWGMTPEEIKKLWSNTGSVASDAGTLLHSLIEDYLNGKSVCSDEATWLMFLEFTEDCCSNLEPYRTEWMVYDGGVKISGCIDMVYKKSDGTYAIYDWKRCKPFVEENMKDERSLNELISHIPNTDYWKYVIQLNTYRMILRRCYGITVTELKLVRFGPENTIYEVKNVSILQEEMDALFEELEQKLKK